MLKLFFFPKYTYINRRGSLCSVIVVVVYFNNKNISRYLYKCHLLPTRFSSLDFNPQEKEKCQLGFDIAYPVMCCSKKYTVSLPRKEF